jgi:hypothetical protein
MHAGRLLSLNIIHILPPFQVAWVASAFGVLNPYRQVFTIF